MALKRFEVAIWADWNDFGLFLMHLLSLLLCVLVRNKFHLLCPTLKKTCVLFTILDYYQLFKYRWTKELQQWFYAFQLRREGRVANVSDVVHRGQRVKVKVLSMTGNKISLSMKVSHHLSFHWPTLMLLGSSHNFSLSSTGDIRYLFCLCHGQDTGIYMYILVSVPTRT